MSMVLNEIKNSDSDRQSLPKLSFSIRAPATVPPSAASTSTISSSVSTTHATCAVTVHGACLLARVGSTEFCNSWGVGCKRLCLFL